MWKYCLFVSALTASTMGLADYSITPSNQVAYYHYPAPPRPQQFQSAASQSSQYRHGQQQQPQQQQRYQQQNRFSQSQNGKSQYPSNNYYRSPAVAKQFNSPALDNAAFNAALRSTGSRPQTFNPPSPAGSSSNSLNIKLPLPFNITPLNIAPLPLQSGTPYSALPKVVNSYGTTYPQRKRRQI